MKLEEAMMNIGNVLPQFRGTLQEHQILQQSYNIIATALKSIKDETPEIVVPTIPFPTKNKLN